MSLFTYQPGHGQVHAGPTQLTQSAVHHSTTNKDTDTLLLTQEYSLLVTTFAEAISYVDHSLFQKTAHFQFTAQKARKNADAKARTNLLNKHVINNMDGIRAQLSSKGSSIWLCLWLY